MKIIRTFLVLDIFAKPVFCAWHLYSLRDVPYEVFALSSGKVSTAMHFAPMASSPPVHHDKPYSNVPSADSEVGHSTTNGIGRVSPSARRVAAPVYEPDVL